MKRIILALSLALLMLGCTFKPAPYPAGATPCISDFSCDDHSWCGFPPPPPGYNATRAQCLPGHGEDRWSH